MKKFISGAAVLAASAAPALAHHPLGGIPMETFTHGLLSGAGHPLLGFDHLFFVVAVGIAAVYTGYARSAPAVFIAAMLAGCVMTGFGIGLPLKEAVTGAPLLVVGGVVLSGRALGLASVSVLFAAFGLFHGSTFGDSVAAQEAAMGASVLAGYLIGLGVLQYAIAIAAGLVVKTVFNAAEVRAVHARLAGALIAGAGLYLTMENVKGAVLSALGWGA